MLQDEALEVAAQHLVDLHRRQRSGPDEDGHDVVHGAEVLPWTDGKCVQAQPGALPRAILHV